MARRRIIEIDRGRCNGCGLCARACHEGAIRMRDGKAELVSDIYCDGLGDCIGECPVDAISIVEREADDFDPQAVARRQAGGGDTSAQEPPPPLPCGCPGTAARKFQVPHSPAPGGPARPSMLTHWPVQLHLIPVQAPFLKGARLLLAADCVPFAYPDFHQELLTGRTLAVGCPKLDDTAAYLEKLTAIIRENDLESLEVAYMEVPCCGGLVRLAEQALAAAGSDLPLSLHRIGVEGGRIGEERG